MSKVNVRNRNAGKYYKDGREKPANWEYRFEKAPINGKRQQHSQAGFKTKKSAFEAGTQALAEYLNAGQINKLSEISVSDFLDQWYTQYVLMNTKPSTHKNYQALIRNHIKPELGNYHLKAITPAVMIDYFNNQKNKGKGQKTIRSIHILLKSAFKYAVEPLQYIKVSPMQNVKIPRVTAPNRQRIVIPDPDWKQILDRFPFKDKYHVPLMIGYHTGLRISEVFGLTWNDIDLDAATISVNRQQMRYKPFEKIQGLWCIAPPKTKSSKRTVKIGNTLLELLKKENKRQKKLKLFYGEYYTKYEPILIKDDIHEVRKVYENSDKVLDFVCKTDDGRWMNTDTFRWCSHVIHHQMNLAFDFHSLRHTHATLLAQAGVNPKSLQMRLGHENLETTLKHYVHDTEEMRQQTVDIFEKIVSGQKI